MKWKIFSFNLEIKLELHAYIIHFHVIDNCVINSNFIRGNEMKNKYSTTAIPWLTRLSSLRKTSSKSKLSQSSYSYELLKSHIIQGIF